MAALAAALEGQWGEVHRYSGHRMLLWGALGAVPVLCWGLSALLKSRYAPMSYCTRPLNHIFRAISRACSCAGVMSVSAYHMQPHDRTTLGQQVLLASSYPLLLFICAADGQQDVSVSRSWVILRRWGTFTGL